MMDPTHSTTFLCTTDTVSLFQRNRLHNKNRKIHIKHRVKQQNNLKNSTTNECFIGSLNILFIIY
ncbi:hypothetical protein HMPREF1548_04553 [Clostridium sp. KLE 1755]|nr:hypothetical protein HMPREF1548_04553 [Clostridium sp. KLE 1755]